MADDLKNKSGGGTMYAWSNFPTEFDDYGHVTKSIEVGDTVSQSDLGVSDDEWEYLIESGAVSEEEYPDIPKNISPAEYQTQLDTHSAMQSEIEMHQQAIDDLTGADEDEEEAAPKATTASASSTRTSTSTSKA